MSPTDRLPPIDPSRWTDAQRRCADEIIAGPRRSELAILVTSSHWDQQVEWSIHLPIAQREGIACADPAYRRGVTSGCRRVAHPVSDGPATLPRHMWSSTQFAFRSPLHVGDRVSRSSTIDDVSGKEGRTGAPFVRSAGWAVAAH